MQAPPRALPPHTASLRDPGAPSPAPEPATFAVPCQPLDFDGTARLSDDALRAMARSAPEPGARLAAIWRLMIRGQALPQDPPTEGIRMLTLINLATQQDLDLLAGLLALDPSSDVRVRAADMLWRVARDRDRVVGPLAARLADEPSLDVIQHILALRPVLPLGHVRPSLPGLLAHPLVHARLVGWRFWLDHGGGFEPELIARLRAESNDDLRAWCALRWAPTGAHAEMLAEATAHAGAAREIILALVKKRVTFPLAEVVPLLVLERPGAGKAPALVQTPLDRADRARLMALLDKLPPELPSYRSALYIRAWRESVDMMLGLWQLLATTFEASDAPPPEDLDRAWARGIEARLGPQPEEDSELAEIMRRVLVALRRR